MKIMKKRSVSFIAFVMAMLLLVAPMAMSVSAITAESVTPEQLSVSTGLVRPTEFESRSVASVFRPGQVRREWLPNHQGIMSTGTHFMDTWIFTVRTHPNVNLAFTVNGQNLPGNVSSRLFGSEREWTITINNVRNLVDRNRATHSVRFIVTPIGQPNAQSTNAINNIRPSW